MRNMKLFVAQLLRNKLRSRPLRMPEGVDYTGIERRYTLGISKVAQAMGMSMYVTQSYDPVIMYNPYCDFGDCIDCIYTKQLRTSQQYLLCEVALHRGISCSRLPDVKEEPKEPLSHIEPCLYEFIKLRLAILVSVAKQEHYVVDHQFDGGHRYRGCLIHLFPSPLDPEIIDNEVEHVELDLDLAQKWIKHYYDNYIALRKTDGLKKFMEKNSQKRIVPKSSSVKGIGKQQQNKQNLLIQNSSNSSSRNSHRQEVLLRAQRLLEEKRRELEEKQRIKEIISNETKFAVNQTKTAEVRYRNRITEEKIKQAKILQTHQQQLREEKLRNGIHRIDEASHRHENKIMFCRLHTSNDIVYSFQRVKANRSLAEMEEEEKKRFIEEKEENRRRIAEEERISREIEMQQRRLLHDERILRSIEYQQQQEIIMREKILERQREREERLWRHRLQKEREKFNLFELSSRESPYLSTSRQRKFNVNSLDGFSDLGKRRYHRTMSTSAFGI